MRATIRSLLTSLALATFAVALPGTASAAEPAASGCALDRHADQLHACGGKLCAKIVAVKDEAARRRSAP